MTETKPVDESPTAGTPANVYDHSTPVATATAVGDVEAQKGAAASATSEYDDEAGKGIGIAMFVCIVVGFCLGWIPGIGSFISFVCIIAAIVLSSCITCGCCCGANLNINPKVKRWSTATLLCLVLQWVLALLGIIVGVLIQKASTSPGVVISEAAFALVYAVLIICQILYVMSGVFAGIFTWGRKSCGNA